MNSSTGLRRFVSGPPSAAQAGAVQSQPPPAPAPAPVVEKCDLCATEVAAEHGHLADLDQSSLMCACRACYLLFTGTEAARGRFRAVPDRYLADPAHPLSAADWEELEIPVGLAFFLRSSRQATVTGFYPSPAGATECQLDLAAWDRLTATHPLLGAAEIPLLLLFSGSVFATTDGRLAVQQVPWSKEAPYRLPLSTWREAIDAHFPDSAWIKMSTATLDDLLRFKTSRALPTWDATLSALLKLAGS